MQTPIEEMPTIMDTPEVKVRGAEWGGLTASYMQFAKGVDFTPLTAGLPDNMCQCPHWGYVLKGRVRVRYTGGKEEILEAGQAFHMPPGHTAVFEEETAYVEFSPTKEMNEALNHVAGKFSR